MDPIEVDGSQGEGGGQILRSALTFSVIRGTPVRVSKIRAGRETPGLKRQHVSALRVLASVFGGTMEGAEEGSTTVRFAPGDARLESHSADTGTAASITLILQSVIPAVALSGSKLVLNVTGGTDVPWSPTFDYFRSMVLPGYRALGIDATAAVTQRGYYPRGGGSVTVEILPSSGVRHIDFTTPAPPHVVLESRCGALPKRVAERQAQAASRRMAESGVKIEVVVVSEEPSLSPGTSVAIHTVSPSTFLGFDAIGAKGKPAEAVGDEAAEGFVSALSSGACMDSHIADMLLPLLALARSPSRVRIQGVTPHLESGMRLAEQFTACTWAATREEGSTVAEVFPAPS